MAMKGSATHIFVLIVVLLSLIAAPASAVDACQMSKSPAVMSHADMNHGDMGHGEMNQGADQSHCDQLDCSCPSAHCVTTLAVSVTPLSIAFLPASSPDVQYPLSAIPSKFSLLFRPPIAA